MIGTTTTRTNVRKTLDTTNAGEITMLGAFHHHMSIRLPALLDRAAQNYERLSAVEPPIEAKAFTAYQAGCRSALAHIRMLLGLASWIQIIEKSQHRDEFEDINRLIDDAKAALRSESFFDH